MKNSVQQPILVDRGVDIVLLAEDQVIRIDTLSAMQLIDLLNRYGLTNIQTVTFSEYDKSSEYPKAVI